jgi:Flp pilus assembly protein TadD
MALYGLGLAFQHKGQHRKGLGEFRKSYESSGGGAAAVMLLGVTHALSGRTKSADKELAKLRGLAKQGYVPSVYEAFVHVALGDLDRAFEALYRAVEERSSYMIFLNVQPSFENMRSDRRYADLLKLFGDRPLC